MTPAVAMRDQTRKDRMPLHLRQRFPLRPTPETFAAAAVFGLGLSNFIGALAILMFFGFTTAVVVMRPLQTLRQVMLFSPLLMYSFLAMLSTMWSDAPQHTMRSSFELLITCAATIVIARTLPPRRFLLALFGTFLLFIVLLLPYVPSSLAGQGALTGFMGSKNQVGFVAYITFALAVAVVVDRGQRGWWRLAAMAVIPVALLYARLADSGGTTSSIVLFLAVFPPLALLAAFRLPLRVALVVVALLCLATAALFIDDIQAAIAAFRGGVLNKDATLTGRTYLWEVAERLSATRPVWGHGYAAFWRLGNIEAEGLWRWAGVGEGGFNFHNELVETRVALGIVGEVVLICTCVGVAATALVRQVTRPSVALACLTALALVSYVRAYVEDGLAAPFSLVTVMMLATALYAFPNSSGLSYRVSRSSIRGIATLGPRRIGGAGLMGAKPRIL